MVSCARFRIILHHQVFHFPHYSSLLSFSWKPQSTLILVKKQKQKKRRKEIKVNMKPEIKVKKKLTKLVWILFYIKKSKRIQSFKRVSFTTHVNVDNFSVIYAPTNELCCLHDCVLLRCDGYYYHPASLFNNVVRGSLRIYSSSFVFHAIDFLRLSMMCHHVSEY